VAVDESRSGWTKNINRHLPDDDDLCILNDDCVVRIGWLATLWDELEGRENCWFAGPSGPCRTPPQNSGHPNDERPPQVVSHVAGFCIVVKREAVKALGPLDETLIHYGSDVDWQWRAQRDYDKTSVWVPSCYVDHGLHDPHEPWYSMDNHIFWKRWSSRW
jgi:GT2 family glycosyltransferase